jgi:hypothetical protein
MQQLDMMDIAGQKIGVKIAPMSAGETAQLAANAARLDLDDEGESTGHLHDDFTMGRIKAMIANISSCLLLRLSFICQWTTRSPCSLHPSLSIFPSSPSKDAIAIRLLGWQP